MRTHAKTFGIACIAAGVALLAACSRDPAPSTAAAATPAAEAPARTDAPGAAGPDITAPAAREPTFVLPGTLAAGSTLADLRALHGAQHVQPGEVPGAEGETAQGAVLYPDDPPRRAYVYLDGEKITSIRVWDRPSQWRLADGIGIGTTLAGLVEKNGKPIRFYGMDWDYGGTVSDWNGGALDPAKAPGVWRSIRLGTREDIGQTPYPMGDGEFSSDDKAYPTLGRDLVVGEIGVSLQVPEEEAAPGEEVQGDGSR